jgi:hypothetical protein
VILYTAEKEVRPFNEDVIESKHPRSNQIKKSIKEVNLK